MENQRKATPRQLAYIQHLRKGKGKESLEIDEDVGFEDASTISKLVLIAINTGMRLGEILSLTWEAVDLSRKTIMVFESKNNEKRTIPINTAVFELLRAKSKVRPIKTNLVFYNTLHNNPESLRGAVDALYEKTLRSVTI